MAEFQVTASALKEKAELLRQLGERYTNKVQELVLAQQKLSASWEGAGKAAFDRVSGRLYEDGPVSADCGRVLSGAAADYCGI